MLFAVIAEQARPRLFALMDEARAAGVTADAAYGSRRLKRMLELASKRGDTRVVIVGDDEWEREQATVRDMTSGEQRSVALDELVRELAGGLERDGRRAAAGDAGTRVTVAGWVARRRDHGGLVFVDLRDRAGIVQLVLDPDQGQAHAAAHDLRNEYVVQAEGVVTPRSSETVNPKLPTGEVEIRVDRLEVLSAASVLPFQLDEENVDETLRLHHRYLDLRRDAMRHNLRMRFRLTQIIRRHMEDNEFWELETPILYKSTPEGARSSWCRPRAGPASSTRCRSRRRRSSSCTPSPATSATTRSRAASGTRPPAPIAHRSSRSSTSRWRSWTPRSCSA